MCCVRVMTDGGAGTIYVANEPSHAREYPRSTMCSSSSFFSTASQSISLYRARLFVVIPIDSTFVALSLSLSIAVDLFSEAVRAARARGNSIDAEMEEAYPLPACPFCRIASSYPVANSDALIASVPEDPDPNLVSPQCHLLMNCKNVMAFLDIMPITRGHTLVVVRDHVEKIAGMGLSGNEEDRDVSKRR